MRVTWVWRNASQEPGLPPEETVVTCRQKNEAPPLITGPAYDDQVAHVVATPTVDVTGKFLLTMLSYQWQTCLAEIYRVYFQWPYCQITSTI